VSVEADSEGALDDFLKATRVKAQHVLEAEAGEPTYRAGLDFMGLAMREMSPDLIADTNDVPMAIYLIWGALTDQWDAPGRSSGERAAAVGDMKRAATEWLSLADSSPGRKAFLDRWVYEECGYKRPD
jgi:hypothetical protein